MVRNRAGHDMFHTARNVNNMKSTGRRSNFWQPFQCLLARGIVPKNGFVKDLVAFWSVVRRRLLSTTLARGSANISAVGNHLKRTCSAQRLPDQRPLQGRTKFFTGWNGCSSEVKKRFAIRSDIILINSCFY